MALEQELESPDPDLVIARIVVHGGMQAFSGMTALVNVPGSKRATRQGDAERPLLPLRVKDRFVRFLRDRTKTHLSAEVLWPVHGPISNGRPVPIIESRVTSSAS